ncbi:YjdF family protein [Anaerolentibacter hominis]|uniref:YjdF family protein n=1 Tax=Anaerolentibacter hominis TaxID=3079009 RepID=UPI0031B8717E
MDKVSVTVRVIFEEPFWIGIAECIADGKLSVCKVTFGAEPRDYEVYDFFLKHYFQLPFSPAVKTAVKAQHTNPKRLRREAQKQTKDTGMGTKSQQTLKLWQEQNKTERRIISREQKEAEELLKFRMKQQKKKEKHRGR